VSEPTVVLGAGAPARVRRSRVIDRGFRGTTLVVGLGLIALLALMLVELTTGAWRTFDAFGLRFFIGTSWNPVSGREDFGALPFIFGSLVTSGVAIVIGVPIAVGLALLLNQVRGSIANPLTVFVDILAAIPSVVYGLWALFVLKPILDSSVEPFLIATLGKVPLIGALFRGKAQGPDLFTAGVILAIMILPIVSAITREVMATVPLDHKEAALALGATRWEMIRMAILPYSRAGITGAAMLGLGRAIGETIAVTLVVGNAPQIGKHLFDQGYTLAAVIANEFGEAASNPVHRAALIAAGLVLFVLTLVVNAIARFFVIRGSRGRRDTGNVAVTA
jgi:phosphate transport system permease protein